MGGEGVNEEVWTATRIHRPASSLNPCRLSLHCGIKVESLLWARHMPINPGCTRLRHKALSFKGSLSYVVRPCFKKKKNSLP